MEPKALESSQFSLQNVNVVREDEPDIDGLRGVELSTSLIHELGRWEDMIVCFLSNCTKISWSIPG